jgi:hypothetical protein
MGPNTPAGRLGGRERATIADHQSLAVCTWNIPYWGICKKPLTVVLTLRNTGEEDLLQLICPTGKFPHQESKLEVKQAKLIDQATGESWEPFNSGGSLWDWCNSPLGRDQSLGAWMTFKIPDPGKKTFSFSLPILNGSFNHLGLSGRS